MPKLPRLELGEVVNGRFRIDSILGEGGMGMVYQATQLNLNRPVALKIMNQGYEDNRDRFRREARVASALRHRNAVQIYDFGEDGERLFLAMEYLKGDTLRSEVDVDLSPVPAFRVVEIGLQLVDVLAAAHEIDLVHRDLKPENIFLDIDSGGNERVVVVDFGLAFIRGDEDSDRVTDSGILVGTPQYLSPEQARGKAVEQPTDIYSLGVVFYEMLTSYVPFDGESVVEVAAKHLYEEPMPPRRVRPELEIPQELENLVMLMLTKQADQRPSARSVLEHLRKVEHNISSGIGRRDNVVVATRTERMVSPGRAAQQFQYGRPPREFVRLLVVGDMPCDVAAKLRKAGLQLIQYEPGMTEITAQALYIANATPDQIQQMRPLGLPMITDVDPSDINRMTELLRAGVNEVVPSPVTCEELSHKARRAIRRHARTRV
jgi:serine/threonine protein kinase